MQPTPYQELEQEVSRMTCAIRTRSPEIGKALLDSLRERFSVEDVAGIMLVSLEQLVWVDATAFVWSVENLIPFDILREIRRITSVAVGRQLIRKGLQPGEDFSVDSAGKLLLNPKAKAAIAPHVVQSA